MMSNDCDCPIEPWGRYSASGGVFTTANGTDVAMYSFGGDTGSHADGLGGVVRTHWKFPLNLNGNSTEDGACQCWERLADTPVAVGYRGTATQVGDYVYVIGGSDRRREAIDQIWSYSLSQDEWTLVDSQVPTPRWKHAAVLMDETRILITGGRQGRTVLSDAWIFDTADLSWTLVNVTLPPLYRHGMSYDRDRNFAWIHGGLDDTFTRYPSNPLYQLRLHSESVVEIYANTTTPNDLGPPRLASHVMEYISHLDVLLLWSGACTDDSELHIYDIQENQWCRIFPANRPDRRDAVVWSLQYPYLIAAQGDIICYNRQILPISDVHRLDLSSLATSDGAWEMLYQPYNSRGHGREPFCDGTNEGNCQPHPLLSDSRAETSTCSAELLARFAEVSYSDSTDEDTLMADETLMLTKAAVEEPIVPEKQQQAHVPPPVEPAEAAETIFVAGATSGAGSCLPQSPVLPLVLTLLFVLARLRG